VWRRSVIAGAVLAGGLACNDVEVERLRTTTKATYDHKTGALVELTYDVDRNGRIDTWVDMDGARPLRARVDRNEDGRIDRWEYYNENGALTRVGLARASVDKPDAWAYLNAGGQLVRIEVSSVADETRIDRWEYYDTPSRAGEDEQARLVRIEEDTSGDSKPDRWQTYSGGFVATAEFDENADGTRDRRLTYRGRDLALIEWNPDSSGHYTQRTVVAEPRQP
jgi:hypothetical protein